MILKEIELNGFKSFKEKTKLEFDTDVVAIVGPNGAGKSNIVDAIKWLMGEQSTKEIRTTDSSALIFSNREEDCRLDLCSVAVTLEATDQIEDWRPGTYRLEKRYYRDEEAEYLINGEKARRKDIRQLLAGMGVGLDNLAIVSQGEIGSFLSLVPTDRRIVFEEVAQLGHFKANKRRILSDLDGTGRNLERLEDNLADRRRRLGELSEQAEVARNYSVLTEELRYTRGNLLALDLIHTDRNLAKHETRIGEKQEERKSLAEQINGTEAEIVTAEKAIEDLRRQREESLVAVVQHKREVEAKKHDLEKVELQISHAGTAIEGKKTTIREREESISQLQEEIERTGHRIETLDEKRTQALKDETGIRAEYDARVEALRDDEAEIGEIESKLESGAKELERRKGELTETNLRLGNLEESSSGHEKEQEILGRRVVELTSALDKRNADLKIATEGLTSLGERKESLAGTRMELESALADLRDHQSELIREESSIAGELHGLEKLEKDREGLGPAVKAVLNENARGSFDGLIGALSEKIDVESGYEFALESLLGAKLRNLITRTGKGALEVIEWVKESGIGQVTIIPLDQVTSRSPSTLPRGIEKEDAFLGRGIDLVKFDPELLPAVNYALGDSIVVKDLKTGIELRRKYKLGVKMATLEGDLLYPSGVLRGGKARPSASGLLTRKARIESLTADLGTVRSRRENAAMSLLEKDGRLKDMVSELEGIEDSLTANEVLKARAESSIANIEGSLAEAESGLSELKGRVANDVKRRDELESRAEELTSVVESSIADVQKHRAELASKRDSISEQTAEHHRNQTMLERFAIIISSCEEEKTRLTEAIGSRESDIERNRSTIRSSQNEISRIETNLKELDEKRASIETDISDCIKDIPNVSEKQRECEESLQTTRKELADLRELREKQDVDILDIGEEIHKSELKVAILSSEKANLSEKLKAEFLPVYDDLESGKLVAKELGAKGALREKVEELTEKVTGLGEINQLAISEFDSVKEEIRFKEEQRADLLESRDELEKNLAEVEKKSRQVFLEVFEETNKQFNIVFGKLFPKGQAAISLTDPSDPLESGIDIRARFPGKQEVDIIQFSGGEKSIVAIALLFAILRVKPSSFTILDEVEAALDDINVDKFLALVKDFLPGRQFIIITHNKGTMEFANRLYGITMRKDGISRVVSVNLKDWDEKLLGGITGRSTNVSRLTVKELPKPKQN